MDGTVKTIVYPFGVTWTFSYVSGRLSSVTNGLGRTLTFNYTGSRLTSITDGTGRSVSFTVDAGTGLLTSVTDTRSKNWTYAYDASKRLTKVFYPANPTQAIFTNTYDGVGQVKERRDAYNNLTSYYYAGYRTEIVSPNNKSATVYLNAFGDILKSIDQLGKITTQEYDGRGRLKKRIMPEGNNILYTYDSKDNVLTITNVPKVGSGLSNIVETFTYDATYNKVATSKDGKNQTTTYVYDAATGNLLTVQRPAVNGAVPKTTFRSNSRGQLISSIDPTGIQTQWIYDTATEKLLSQLLNTNWSCSVGGTVTVGNVLTINVNDSGLSGGTKAKSYTVIAGDTLAKIATGLANAINADSALAALGIVAYVNSNTLKLSTSAGNTTTFTGNTVGATATLTIAAGLNLSTTLGYNAVGDITSVTDSRGNTTTSSYDLSRRRTQLTTSAPFSYVTKLTYDDNGNNTKIERQTNVVATPWQTVNMTFSFDNKLLTAVDPSSDTTTYQYNNLRLLQQVTDAVSRVTQYAYDDAGRLSTVTDSSSVIAMTKTYTDNGLVSTIKDSRSNITAYTYDGLDRPLRRTFPDSTYVENQGYDANSNPLVRRNRDGSTITLTYDSLDRVQTKSSSGMAVVTFAYDLAGRLLSATKPTVAGDASTGTFSIAYDSAGRAFQQIYPGSKTFTNVLDANGNVTKTTWDDGYFVDRVYDELNRMTTIKFNGSATPAATYTWDALSRPSAISRKNGTSTAFVWEIDNDLSSISQSFTGPTLLPGTLTYSYAYNAAGELSSQNVSDSLYMWHPSSVGTVTYGTADSANHYPTVAGITQFYDGNGNLSQQGATNFYSYNTELQLNSFTTGGVTTSYNYDAFGNMVQKSVGAAVSRSYYLGDTLMGDYSGTGVLQNRYVYGALSEPFAQVTSAGVESFYHSDGQGSVIAISDSGGNVSSRYAYSPFGETAAPLTGTRFGFGGSTYDNASSSYLMATGVSYLPSLGRTGQDAFTMGNGVNPGNPGGYYDPNDPANYDSGGAITDMLRNGSQTNGQYLDSLAQQAAAEAAAAAAQAAAQALKHDLNQALKKGGVGTGRRMTPELIEFLRWLKANHVGEIAANAADILEGIEQILDILTVAGVARGYLRKQMVKALANPKAKGPFSPRNWDGYPQIGGVPKPEGPLILRDVQDNKEARKIWNRTAARLIVDGMNGMQNHHDQPLKFGGDPESIDGLTVLDPTTHSLYTTWWGELQRNVEKPGGPY